MNFLLAIELALFPTLEMQLLLCAIIFLINVTIVGSLLPFDQMKLNALYICGGVATVIEICVLLGVIAPLSGANSKSSSVRSEINYIIFGLIALAMVLMFVLHFRIRHTKQQDARRLTYLAWRKDGSERRVSVDNNENFGINDPDPGEIGTTLEGNTPRRASSLVSRPSAIELMSRQNGHRKSVGVILTPQGTMITDADGEIIEVSRKQSSIAQYLTPRSSMLPDVDTEDIVPRRSMASYLTPRSSMLTDVDTDIVGRSNTLTSVGDNREFTNFQNNPNSIPEYGSPEATMLSDPGSEVMGGVPRRPSSHIALPFLTPRINSSMLSGGVAVGTDMGRSNTLTSAGDAYIGGGIPPQITEDSYSSNDSSDSSNGVPSSGSSRF